MNEFRLTPDLYFSYSQFFVYDEAIQMPACEWTQAHSDQGFARREGTVAFGTLLDFGAARIVVAIGPFHLQTRFERVVAVPFEVYSGRVIVNGPEETETGRRRSFSIRPGNYRLIAAQRVIGDEEEEICLCFEALATPLNESAVLVADESINPPSPLIETARIPSEQQ